MGSGPTISFTAKPRISMLLTLELLLPNQGRVAATRKVPPGAIPPCCYPSIRNLMKDPPASSLGRNTRLGGKSNGKEAWKSPHWGGQLWAKYPAWQRAGSGQASPAAVAVTQLWVWSLHSSPSPTALALPGLASWLPCLLVPFPTAKGNGAGHAPGTLAPLATASPGEGRTSPHFIHSHSSGRTGGACILLKRNQTCPGERGDLGVV